MVIIREKKTITEFLHHSWTSFIKLEYSWKLTVVAPFPAASAIISSICSSVITSPTRSAASRMFAKERLPVLSVSISVKAILCSSLDSNASRFCKSLAMAIRKLSKSIRPVPLTSASPNTFLASWLLTRNPRDLNSNFISLKSMNPVRMYCSSNVRNQKKQRGQQKKKNEGANKIRDVNMLLKPGSSPEKKNSPSAFLSKSSNASNISSS
mmetsp:Transcript_42659/g.166494  ORF Transcript_42659/g.166494 Transcript_42659/m.166494 type:complete len:210 (-) Transcript_42659:118-747(-)